jgi:hypothetical protein
MRNTIKCLKRIYVNFVNTSKIKNDPGISKTGTPKSLPSLI